MDPKWLIAAAVNGFIAVAAGAFGAHYLKTRLGAGELLTFEVAVRYQMYHALALLAVGTLAGRSTGVTLAAGWCFVGGIVLFSGSLYGLSLAGWKWLGPVTPLGGLLFLAGWLLLIVQGITAVRTSAGV